MKIRNNIKKLINAKKEIIELFCYSVNDDLEKWEMTIGDEYFSPVYNNSRFCICNDVLYLYKNASYIEIGEISIFKNFKIWRYCRNVRKYFNYIRNNKLENVEFMRQCANNMRPSFAKNIRKEKLKKLE
jgi:hypothetical protein